MHVTQVIKSWNTNYLLFFILQIHTIILNIEMTVLLLFISIRNHQKVEYHMKANLKELVCYILCSLPRPGSWYKCHVLWVVKCQIAQEREDKLLKMIDYLFISIALFVEDKTKDGPWIRPIQYHARRLDIFSNRNTWEKIGNQLIFDVQTM